MDDLSPPGPLLELDWSQYEAYVFGRLQEMLPQASVRRNVHLRGLKTEAQRQIDVLVEASTGPFVFQIAVDCKCYKRKVDLNDVETFVGMLGDLRISKGVLVTTQGYTEAAQRRIELESHDIELRILSPEQLSECQGIGGGLAWYGPVAALISAPHTWVIDNERTEDPLFMLFSMYPLGRTRASALNRGAFIYGNVSLKSDEEPTMELIAAGHERKILESWPSATFSRLELEKPSDSSPSMLFRVGHIHAGYGGPEYTIYLDHPKGVLLLVLLCPDGEDEAHVPLLKWAASKVQLMDCVVKTE